MSLKNNFWIKSPSFDWWWFIAPMAIPPLVALFLPHQFTAQQKTEIFPWSWILIVLSIDVAHVYSTVYKTYFKPSAWKNHRIKMLIVPFVIWIIGVMAYSISSKLFWSLLAYFAVFHFIRQQYGFFRLYSLKSAPVKGLRKIILNSSIYAAPVIPIIIWHLRGQQNFNWLTAGDFVYFNLPALVPLMNILLAVFAIVYFYVEWLEMKTNKAWNVPRILLTYSTGISYYISVVLINNDFVFSLVNVIGHGIPYLALVWFSEKRTLNNESPTILKIVLAKWGWVLFYLIVFAFAYVEESMWDVLIWRENSVPFGWMYSFVDAISDEQIISFVIPLLIMPQVVHYVLDGYIWREKDNVNFQQPFIE